MTLYLVRHAAVDVRPDRAGEHWHLSAEGRAGADALAEEALWADVAAIHTSFEPKAAGTAQRIAARHGLPLRFARDLREVEGRAWSEAYRELVRRYLAGGAVDGWEPAERALARVRACIQGIVARREGDVAVVSHGLVLTLYLGDLLGLDGEARGELWAQIGFPDLAIVEPQSGRVEREFGR